MKITQQVGLLLSGTVAFNSWNPAWAKDNDSKPVTPTIPVHEAPPQSWPEPPQAPIRAPAGESHFSNIYASGETFDVGGDLGSPVSLEYKSPNRFNGTIDQVTFELK